MRRMHEILRLACDYLNDAGADYVVIGGIAATIHGRPRSTVDLDLIITMKENALRNFIAFLNKNGFVASFDDAQVAFAERSHFSAEDTLSSLRLDIKGVYNEMDERTIARRSKFNYTGIDMMIETPEDLIAAKLFFGSEQDKSDAEAVFRAQKDKLDMDYLETICKSYGLEKKLKNLTKSASVSSSSKRRIRHGGR